MQYMFIFNNVYISHICSGKRWSTASAYLRPVLGRPNLKTEVRCLTTKILFDGNRAMGVEYTQNGQKKRVRCSKEYFPSEILGKMYLFIWYLYLMALPVRVSGCRFDHPLWSSLKIMNNLECIQNLLFRQIVVITVI